MALTNKLDLGSVVKMNQHGRYLGQRSSHSKVVIWTDRHTQLTDCCTWPIKWSVETADMSCSCCRAAVANIIIDGKDDDDDVDNDDDDEEEEKREENTGAAGEQLVTDSPYVLPVKQPSEDASEHG